VQADLYGSLALTGLGHGTDRAVLLGLAGTNRPQSIPPLSIPPSPPSAPRTASFWLQRMAFPRRIQRPPLPSRPDVSSRRAYPSPERTPLTAFDAAGTAIDERTFFSIGGGFISEDEAIGVDAVPSSAGDHAPSIPFPFHSAAELLATAEAHQLSISSLMLENERSLAAGHDPEQTVRDSIERIWQT